MPGLGPGSEDDGEDDGGELFSLKPASGGKDKGKKRSRDGEAGEAAADGEAGDGKDGKGGGGGGGKRGPGRPAPAGDEDDDGAEAGPSGGGAEDGGLRVLGLSKKDAVLRRRELLGSGPSSLGAALAGACAAQAGALLRSQHACDVVVEVACGGDGGERCAPPPPPPPPLLPPVVMCGLGVWAVHGIGGGVGPGGTAVLLDQPWGAAESGDGDGGFAPHPRLPLTSPPAHTTPHPPPAPFASPAGLLAELQPAGVAAVQEALVAVCAGEEGEEAGVAGGEDEPAAPSAGPAPAREAVLVHYWASRSLRRCGRGSHRVLWLVP